MINKDTTVSISIIISRKFSARNVRLTQIFNLKAITVSNFTF